MSRWSLWITSRLSRERARRRSRSSPQPAERPIPELGCGENEMAAVRPSTRVRATYPAVSGEDRGSSVSVSTTTWVARPLVVTPQRDGVEVVPLLVAEAGDGKLLRCQPRSEFPQPRVVHGIQAELRLFIVLLDGGHEPSPRLLSGARSDHSRDQLSARGDLPAPFAPVDPEVRALRRSARHHASATCQRRLQRRVLGRAAVTGFTAVCTASSRRPTAPCFTASIVEPTESGYGVCPAGRSGVAREGADLRRSRSYRRDGIETQPRSSSAGSRRSPSC